MRPVQLRFAPLPGYLPTHLGDGGLRGLCGAPRGPVTFAWEHVTCPACWARRRTDEHQAAQRRHAGSQPAEHENSGPDEKS